MYVRREGVVKAGAPIAMLRRAEMAAAGPRRAASMADGENATAERAWRRWRTHINYGESVAAAGTADGAVASTPALALQMPCAASYIKLVGHASSRSAPRLPRNTRKLNPLPSL